MFSLPVLMSRLVPRFARGPGAASLILRVGLAFTFAYAAIGAFRSPEAWISYVPGFISNVVSAKLALDLISVSQIVLAIWLLTGIYVSLAALVSIGFLAGIIIFNPATFLITFRDVALIAASLALISLDVENIKNSTKK
jgi:uncharacterized membrane protein YphA (DoxX/SURF4 family)